MRCDHGCGECCGVVACSKAEYATIEKVVKAKGIRPVRQGTTCPLYIDGQCSIYEARPLACRLYGHVKDMACPRGYNVNVTREVEREYSRLMVRGGVANAVLLHSLVYTSAEFTEMLGVSSNGGA